MTCSAPGEHRPRAHQTDTHHIVPRSWGGPDVPANRVELCPNHHHNVHALLDEYIRAGGQPATTVLRTYTKLEQQLAAQAWAQRPNDHPPYTLTHPEEPMTAKKTAAVKPERPVGIDLGASLVEAERAKAETTSEPLTVPVTAAPKPMWLDVLDRAGWTFAQTALGVEVAAGAGWYHAGVAKAAGIAAVAAVLSFLKTVAVKANAAS